MAESKQHPIYYHYGYRHIHPLGKENEEWDYSLQLHKNQNGKHFDLRLHRPGEDKAYSWAMKKMPMSSINPVLATRTFDHNLEHMSFEGPMNTAKGYGTVKLVFTGTVKVKKIDDKGIMFEMNKQHYRLRPYDGKKYLFEPVLFEKHAVLQKKKKKKT